MAYDNTMKIEFYKPKYNLDIKFDGDDSFDLLFKNVNGELFFSADVEDYDSYVSFEDEECKFTNGELVAKVDISNLMETIANGQLRNTNGTTYGEWIPRIVGDYKTEHDLVFDGKTYTDRGYWELFFKEMSKDEIKDFIEFCRDYIDIPNLEFSFREFDFNNDNIVVNGKGYPITINDDLTIEMAEEFTCKSGDVVDVWESNHDYGDEFEEKKSTKKSLKEGISAFNKAIAKKYNDTEPNGAGQYYLDWRFDLHDEKDNIEAIADRCGVTVEFQTDEGYFEVFEESKNSIKKSLKESVEFYNDFGTGVYCATSSNGWTFCYCPLSWINKKGVEDLIGWSVMDDKAHYIEGDSWENKTDEEINDSIDNFEKLIKKYAKEDAKEIIKDFRSTLDKD